MERNRLDAARSASSAETRRGLIDRPRSGLLDRLRGNLRARFLAAGLAIGGIGAATRTANAATMHAAQIVKLEPSTPFAEEIAVGFDIRDGVFVDIGNASDATHQAIDFVMIYRGADDYGIDRAGDFGSDVPTEITPNSEFSDGITHDHMFIRGLESLPELGAYRVGADIDPLTGDPDGPADIDDFFGDAMIMVGKNGSLSGTPVSPEQVEQMYSGDVYHARFPNGAGINDNYLMTEVQSPSVPLGDYDRDGDVDSADYLVWRDQFGSAVGGGSEDEIVLTADGNADGVVNAADYTVWRNNLGVGTADSTVAANHSVPEPGTAILLASGLGFSALTVRRRVKEVLHG